MLKMTLLLIGKGLLGLSVLGAVVYLAVCAFLLLRQNRLIFFPTAAIETKPDSLNLRYRDVWIPVNTSEQGTTEQIHAWWIPTSGSERAILHLHGNGYNVGANLSQALQFHQLGLSVLMIDYRGYGRSKGNFPTEGSVYQDAEAAWNYLTQQQGIAPEQVFVFGHSLGGAIAIDLAVNHAEAAGLIVQSSFTSMRAMVDGTNRFWMLPINLLLTQRFDSIHKVQSLKLPVLYIHGTADETVPATMSETLMASTPEPKQLLLVTGAGHNDVAEIGGNQYLHTIEQFVQQVYMQKSGRVPR